MCGSQILFCICAVMEGMSPPPSLPKGLYYMLIKPDFTGHPTKDGG